MLGRLPLIPRATALLVALLCALLVTTVAPAQAVPIEGYASYDPQENCRPKAKPGTKMLARWLVNKRGGARGPISRVCSSGGVSEHKEGRAFDWVLDATKPRQREKAKKLLNLLFRTNGAGEPHAKARRMGIMYIIWNDHMYRSYREFEKDDYLSSSCRRKRTCSKSLRHRDHMHISLSRKGGRGKTSWYLARSGD
ncbi:hypothetical protein [Nocardioides donggukensis]|uniref:ARB-07466-like C-terminal domain-containing protein n=1 Tax=Nocardioides donggukensis TaxID=2774019 RepID=A0A927Q2U4_9ACTN|nr:hypothetical protein [Nocardioides donggukensis]MBD8870719.1 hypothetical protein [Nocardioides donggukensis]